MRRFTIPGFPAALAALLLLGGLLAGCAAAGAAPAVKATATCAPTPPITTVTGKITATGSGSITVTTSGGTAKLVQVPSTARITDVVPVAPAALTAGTPVLVVTDTAATTAQRIQVLSGAGTGAGGFGGRPGASGTPPAGVNTSCFRRQGQGQGQGQSQGSGTGRGPGGFAGLRGTVDSATATNLTFDDTTGQTYSVAITATTVISKTAAGQLGDLRVGARVMVTGTTSGASIVARSITVQPAAA